MKRSIRILLSLLLVLGLAACSSKATDANTTPETDNTAQTTPEPTEEPAPYTDYSGYYELVALSNADGEDGGLSEEDIQAMKEYGYIISLEITGNSKAVLDAAGDKTYLDFDPETMTLSINDETITVQEEGNMLVLIEGDSSMSFAPAEKSEAPAVSTVDDTWKENKKRVGYEGIGYFDIPESWNDLSETDDPDLITLTYESQDQQYQIMAYTYTKEQWSEYGSDLNNPNMWLYALTEYTAQEYADILISKDYQEDITVLGYNGARGDLIFSDDSTLTNIFFIDENETIHVLTFETFTPSSNALLDTFIDSVLSSYSMN